MTQSSLTDLLQAKIQAAGRITFAEYMDTVLYAPKLGYYEQGRFGPKGDFYTSVHLGSDFGELLALQIWDFWQALGKPDPFTVVECGAGEGLIAADILNFCPTIDAQFAQALDYVLIERSERLVQIQQERLQGFKARWTSWVDLEPVIGCVFSNELIDAFGVHRVTRTLEGLQEVYVTWGNEGFQECLGELSTPQIQEYLALVEIDLLAPGYALGYTTEINLQALTWLQAVAAKIHRGYVLTIDYGYPAKRYYQPTRSQGTLLCYHGHTTHSDPYRWIGEQDLTAHVDFTALERWGTRCGLTTLDFTQQALLLMALGLGDRIQALKDANLNLQEAFKRHQALHSLIAPGGLGGFGVLIQAKGLTDQQQGYLLKGLRQDAE